MNVTQAYQSRVTLTLKRDEASAASLESLMLEVDDNKIAQVVRNMVSNGLKFTKPGGTVTVNVSTLDQQMDSGDYCKLLKVSVTDSGAGISQVGDDATPS